MRPQINSRKHYVQVSLNTILAGALSTVVIADVKEAPTGADEVRVGATVKAVYIEMWVRTNDTSPGTALLSFYKGKQDGFMTFAEHVALDSYNGKSEVYYHTQGLTNDQDADAIPFMRGWYKVPKSKQRMALGDALNLAISAQALDQNVCGFATYKEYF